MENQFEETHRCELLYRLRREADPSWRDQLDEWPTENLIALDRFYRSSERVLVDGLSIRPPVYA